MFYRRISSLFANKKTSLAAKHRREHRREHRLACGLLLGSVAFVSMPALAADGDNDGIDDAADAAPCTPSIASMQAIPAEGQFATLAFEDQWPSSGDYDFNDLILDYHVEIYKNSAGLTTQIRYIFNPRAMGAAFDNGVAVHLPISRSEALGEYGVTLTRKIGTGPVQTHSLRTDENDVVFDVANNVRTELFGGAAGQVNTVDNNGTSAGLPVEINLYFETGSDVDTSGAPFDVFLFRTGEYGHQIHLPQFGGTTGMRQNLFNTLDDGSTPSKKFVDTRGVPFVLHVPQTSSFPKEGRRIDALFPRIVDFAASGGSQFSNFYNVDINNTHAYGRALSGPPTVAVTPERADQACLVRVGQTAQSAGSGCKDVLLRNPDAATGLHFVDLDGDGPNPAQQVFCDMTTDGGGWTLVSYASIGSNGVSGNNSIRNLFSMATGGGTYDGATRNNTASLPAVPLGKRSTEILFTLSNRTNINGNILSYDDVSKFTLPDTANLTFGNANPTASSSERGLCVPVTVTTLKGPNLGTTTRFTFSRAVSASWGDTYPTGYGAMETSSCMHGDKGPMLTNDYTGVGNFTNYPWPRAPNGSAPTYWHRGWYSVNTVSITGAVAIWLR